MTESFKWANSSPPELTNPEPSKNRRCLDRSDTILTSTAITSLSAVIACKKFSWFIIFFILTQSLKNVNSSLIFVSTLNLKFQTLDTILTYFRFLTLCVIEILQIYFFLIIVKYFFHRPSGWQSWRPCPWGGLQDLLLARRISGRSSPRSFNQQTSVGTALRLSDLCAQSYGRKSGWNAWKGRPLSQQTV